MLSGPGRELRPSAIGARKYPLTPVCQEPPGGSGSAAGFTSGLADTAAGGAVGCAVGGGVAASSSDGRSLAGSSSALGSSAAAEIETRHASNTKDAWNRRSIGARLLTVPGGHDVGLKGVGGRQRRGAGRHHAFEPLSGTAVAVVPAGPEDDGPLLLHGDVAGRANPVPLGRQDAALRVATIKSEAPVRIRRARARAAGLPGARVADDDGRDEVVLEGRIGRNILVLIVLPAGKETVFEVRHDPRSVGVAPGRARAPSDAPAEIDRFHGGGAVVVEVRFGVAVIEAAPFRPGGLLLAVLAGHHVFGLGRVAGGRPRR